MSQIEQQSASGVYILAPTYSVIVLIMVFVGVMSGALIAVGVIARGFQLPVRPRAANNTLEGGRASGTQADREIAVQSRAARTAAAAVAMERRDTAIFGAAGGGGDTTLIERRTTVGGGGARAERGGAGGPMMAAPTRLGQETRRASGPRAMRAAGGGAGGLR